MKIDHQKLKNEINTDPNNLGLTFSKTDKENADLLKNILINSDTDKNTELLTSDILKTLIDTELEALTSKQLNILQLILTPQTIDMSNINILNSFKKLFIQGTATRTNLIALSTKKISRAEKLFKQNISMMDVHIARRTS